ncbi:MAG: methylated-DNA--[protein]-cysteine S-methyltransferase [Oryzomonas sp.]
MTVHQFILEHLDTPIGRMLIVTDADCCVRALDWEDHEQRMLDILRIHYGGNAVRLCEASRPSAARRSLQAYFEGDIGAITDLATATNGTDFQRAVWSELRRIPAGQAISYAALAARIGRPTATRAVGRANGANPIPVVVPCHRVIGMNGSLTGFGGGLDRKRWLLDHESAWAASHGDSSS